MEDTVQPKYLDSEQAAAYVGFSVHFIRDAAATGELKSYRSGRFKHHRFLREDLDAWMQERANQGSTAPKAAS